MLCGPGYRVVVASQALRRRVLPAHLGTSTSRCIIRQAQDEHGDIVGLWGAIAEGADVFQQLRDDAGGFRVSFRLRQPELPIYAGLSPLLPSSSAARGT